MSRPELDAQAPVTDFRAFYWLKSELVAFCREQGLSTAGAKTELARRIEVFLTIGEASRDESQPRRRSQTGKMPDLFTRETVIGPNWRCSQRLRAFFEEQVGPQFHFNGVMRDFIKRDGVGKTLQDAIEAWHQDQGKPKTETEIAPQFEYNLHIRKFFGENPGKTLQDAIAAWNKKKAKRKEGL